MVNLLPEKTKRSLTLLYYSRFLSAAVFFVALAVLAGAAVLVPSYVRSIAEADAATRFLEASQKAVSLGSRGGVSGQFAALSERVKILTTYAWPASTARVLSALSTHVPKGVYLTKIAVTPTNEAAGKVSITGKASTRAGLLAFVSALQSVSAFQGVVVPVQSLASDANVDFTLAFSFNLPHS